MSNGTATTVTGGTGGTGTTTTIDPSQSTLSASFGPYVQDMLSRGAGLANLEFLPFTGQRFAGFSPLQKQAFTGYHNIQDPGQFQTATDLFTRAGTAAQGMGYTPTTTGNFFQAPGQYRPSTDFTTGIGQGQYQAGQFTPGFNYQPGQVTTGLGPVGSVQDYMTPYMSGVTDIAAREARRQADISRQTEQARLAQAGAFGGSRQAIMEAERQRNLGEQIGDITSRGLQSAFDRAQQQRLQEAQLGVTAQEATERARQFGAERGAQFGLEAQKAGEASRQFGAQFGQQGLGQLLEARRAQEQSRQFGAQQGMTAAQEAARYGLAGAQQTEASRQFGAQYGLDALTPQLTAAQGLGLLGTQQSAVQRQNLADVLKAGEVQRAIAQQPLDFGYQQFQESLKYPYQQATYMQSLLQGMPLRAPEYQTGASDIGRILSGGLLGGGLYDILFREN